MRVLLLLPIAVVTVFVSAAARDTPDECVYTLYVKTGSIIKAGTDAQIGVTLGDASGRSVWVPDLRPWGLMDSKHDYFERGNVDIFSGRGRCIDRQICRLNISSDGSGSHPGWYCDYVEVTSTGPHRRCGQSIFYVDRWLSLDAPPYQLSAILDGCKRYDGPPRHGNYHGPLVVSEEGSGPAW
ncbi:Embryo-specific ATS3 [Dillenia turbinata]|uniref:Embryo-specific ATS3 n=1 Tax=Dillenia turbinata TaxID=194707 RepID=A0AAN8ZFM5_9MAGN